uniref:Putative secreted protein n=1 Tax=Ixodes ricinus TaxID=34613 RepID=A0A6B0TTW4_IXORI
MWLIFLAHLLQSHSGSVRCGPKVLYRANPSRRYTLILRIKHREVLNIRIGKAGAPIATTARPARACAYHTHTPRT